MKVESMLPISHSQDEINPVGANDYVYEKVTSYDEVFKVGY